MTYGNVTMGKLERKRPAKRGEPRRETFSNASTSGYASQQSHMDYYCDKYGICTSSSKKRAKAATRGPPRKVEGFSGRAPRSRHSKKSGCNMESDLGKYRQEPYPSSSKPPYPPYWDSYNPYGYHDDEDVETFQGQFDDYDKKSTQYDLAEYASSDSDAEFDDYLPDDEVWTPSQEWSKKQPSRKPRPAEIADVPDVTKAPPRNLYGPVRVEKPVCSTTKWFELLIFFSAGIVFIMIADRLIYLGVNIGMTETANLLAPYLGD